MTTSSSATSGEIMSFRYFAYGSHMWPPEIRSLCPSARPLGVASLEGWATVYDKPSADGSTTLNIRPEQEASVDGVVFELTDEDRVPLDAASRGYTAMRFPIDGVETLTYAYGGESSPGPPYDWYQAVVDSGAAAFGVDPPTPVEPPTPDLLAPGIRPAGRENLEQVQRILSAGLHLGGDRYFIHPGDYAWWVFHDDPRYPDHFSTWLQGDEVVLTIDSREPREINVFTLPGVDPMPLVRWSQRRLNGEGEVGYVADRDIGFATRLRGEGYEPAYAFRSYEWDLEGDLPEVRVPEGWTVRAVRDETEANTRRAASHAAFESKMPEAMHLQRYLDFMRSPVYVGDRDLVAVDADGRVGSFMIWWGDSSGIAQIEPFGTHPDFHRRGIARALMYHGLAEMKHAGMRLARVCTDDDRPATAFYEGVGFRDVDRLRWWKKSQNE
jgi:mycothiol synthase